MKRRRLRRLVIIACLLASAFGGYRWWRATRPNVLLIVVDTLRADRLGSYGSQRGLTPFLDELAATGVVFRHAYAPSSWTCPSIASLFTSRFPSQHHVTALESVLDIKEVTLGESLRAAGYAPAGYLANWRLTDSLGYAQGFRRWWLVWAAPQKVRGDALRREAMSWLRLPWPQPRFLYLHYMEPHFPYEPRAPHQSPPQCDSSRGVDAAAAGRKLIAGHLKDLSLAEVTCLESLYDGEVASVDSELRALFGELRENGFLDHALVVITADHGEEFFEHHGMLHGTTLFGELVRVPLIMLGTDVTRGVVVDEPVSLVDVAPTLLDLLGVAKEPRFEGRSLARWLRRLPEASNPGPPPVADRPILLELEPEGTPVDRQRRHLRGLIDHEVKLLIGQDGATDLYDLDADPGELRPNTLTDLATRRQTLGESLTALRDDLRARAGVAMKQEVFDDAAREKLRALGYGD